MDYIPLIADFYFLWVLIFVCLNSIQPFPADGLQNYMAKFGNLYDLVWKLVSPYLVLHLLHYSRKPDSPCEQVWIRRYCTFDTMMCATYVDSRLPTYAWERLDPLGTIFCYEQQEMEKRDFLKTANTLDVKDWTIM